MKDNLFNHNKRWTDEEDEFLMDKIGVLSYVAIGKKLGRTPKAIKERRKQIGVEDPKNVSDFITKNYLAEKLGIDHKTIERWSEKYNLKIVRKNIFNEKYITRIKISDFWKWAKNHEELINWNKFKVDNLGVEPKWVRKVRENYKKPKHRYKEWTKKEVELLKSYYKLGISVKTIAKNMNRTEQAIYSRTIIENIKRCGNKKYYWTTEQISILNNLLSEGLTTKQIAEKMDKTPRSIQLAKWRYINKTA